jgi:hypothetical protein
MFRFVKTLLFTLPLLYACSSPTQQESRQAPAPDTNPDVGHYQSLGDSIALAAQKALLQRVSAALQEGGPVYAVEFCRLQALPLTDSLSKAYQVQISRVAQRNRNPHNQAAGNEELALFEKYAQQRASGQALADTAWLQGNQVVYYKPIMLGMPACLQCHGVPESEIDGQTLAVIREKYPEDKAIGFALGELRGLWKLQFSVGN